MTTKLTLSLQKDVIHKAKKFAKNKNKSLSRIIEEYLSDLTKSQKETNTRDTIPPITKELAGILKNKKNLNTRSSIASFLEEKYK
jgi:DNA-directed RNA polymerase subunit F